MLDPIPNLWEIFTWLSSNFHFLIWYQSFYNKILARNRIIWYLKEQLISSLVITYYIMSLAIFLTLKNCRFMHWCMDRQWFRTHGRRRQKKNSWLLPKSKLVFILHSFFVSPSHFAIAMDIDGWVLATSVPFIAILFILCRYHKCGSGCCTKWTHFSWYIFKSGWTARKERRTPSQNSRRCSYLPWIRWEENVEIVFSPIISL